MDCGVFYEESALACSAGGEVRCCAAREADCCEPSTLQISGGIVGLVFLVGAFSALACGFWFKVRRAFGSAAGLTQLLSKS